MSDNRTTGERKAAAIAQVLRILELQQLSNPSQVWVLHQVEAAIVARMQAARESALPSSGER